MDGRGKGLEGAQVSASTLFHTSTDSTGICSVPLQHQSSILLIVLSGYEPVELDLSMRKINYISVYLNSLSSPFMDSPVLGNSGGIGFSQQLDLDAPSYLLSSHITDALEKQGLAYILRQNSAQDGLSLGGINPDYSALHMDGMKSSSSASANLYPRLNHLDPSAIETAHIISGNRTVEIGSESASGMLSIVSHRPSFAKAHAARHSLDYNARINTAQNEKYAQLRLQYHGRRLALLSNISYADLGDLRVGKNGSSRRTSDLLRDSFVLTQNSIDRIVPNENPRRQVPSGMSQLRLQQQIAYTIQEGITLLATIDLSTMDDVPAFGELASRDSLTLFWAQNAYSTLNRQSASISLHYLRRSKYWDQMKASLSRVRQDRTHEYRRYASPWLTSENTSITLWQAQIDATKDLTELYPQLSVDYGLLLQIHPGQSRSQSQSLLDSSLATREPTVISNDSRLSRSEIYALTRYEGYEDLILQTGIRMGLQTISSRSPITEVLPQQDVDEVNWSKFQLAWHVGASYQVSEEFQTWARVDLGYHNPFLTDLAHRSAREGILVLPNADIKNERNLRLEIGGRMDIPAKWPFSDTHIQWMGYLQNIYRKIGLVENPLDGLAEVIIGDQTYTSFHSQNVGIWNQVGTQLEIRSKIWDIHRLVYCMQWSGSSLEIEENFLNIGDQPIHMPFFGSFRWLTEIHKWELEGALVFGGSQAQRMNPFLDPTGIAFNNRSEIESRLDVNLYAKYRWRQNIHVAAGIENLMHQASRNLASGIPNPGRQLVLRISGKLPQKLN